MNEQICNSFIKLRLFRPTALTDSKFLEIGAASLRGSNYFQGNIAFHGNEPSDLALIRWGRGLLLSGLAALTALASLLTALTLTGEYLLQALTALALTHLLHHLLHLLLVKLTPLALHHLLHHLGIELAHTGGGRRLVGLSGRIAGDFHGAVEHAELLEDTTFQEGDFITVGDEPDDVLAVAGESVASFQMGG